MSTPSRFKKDKEIIAEYESQVKGKDGSGRLALLCASLLLCSGSCISNLVSALAEGSEGQLELLAKSPGLPYKPVPVPFLVPSNPQGAGNRVAFPDCQRAPPVGKELAST